VCDRVDDQDADGCGGGRLAVRATTNAKDAKEERNGREAEREGFELMDITAIEGQELTAVEFVGDHLRLHFDGPRFTLYAWPTVLLSDFSVAFGEPEYRNALCAHIGQIVEKAMLEDEESLTIELENGTAFGLSLHGEDVDGPVVGSYSETGDDLDEVEF